MMNRPIRYALSTAGMLAFALAASGPASAAFVAAICDNIACSGAVVRFKTTRRRHLPAVGAIQFTTSAFGFTLIVYASQSKPFLGSATAPQID